MPAKTHEPKHPPQNPPILFPLQNPHHRCSKHPVTKSQSSQSSGSEHNYIDKEELLWLHEEQQWLRKEQLWLEEEQRWLREGSPIERNSVAEVPNPGVREEDICCWGRCGACEY
ncbi:unnamed protein product [Linum trigynum]|uniref:Uncharacterized protein n=1 Tax=Linum trigynum TaxID=586398 RepID=A0AAV2GMY7_9ROSI